VRPETTQALAIDSRASGSLDHPFAVDAFTIPLSAGDSFHMDSGGTCPHPGSFAVTLVAPSGRAVERSSGQGCGSFGVTALRESGTYEVRVQDVGGYRGSYSFGVSGEPLGLTCTATNAGPNDDESSPEVALPFPVRLGESTYNSLWVNTNGNVTFDGPMADYVPTPFATFFRPVVAAYWDDVDTRGPTDGQVRYGTGSVGGRPSFCVRWDAVARYDEPDSDQARNTFRLYLVDRGDVAPGDFDIVLQYASIEWNEHGAAVGYTNGSGEPGTFFELPGSRTDGAFLDGTATSLAAGSTAGQRDGVYVYPIR
jgi:hypothetical protein